jgi:hypothetical protein
MLPITPAPSRATRAVSATRFRRADPEKRGFDTEWRSGRDATGYEKVTPDGDPKTTLSQFVAPVFEDGSGAVGMTRSVACLYVIAGGIAGSFNDGAFPRGNARPLASFNSANHSGEFGSA